MAKPFSKNQVGYMRHRKFLALNANAIALWHEGKDYCSEHLTDGLIPTAALKGFRFRSTKAVDLLSSSCGSKPDGVPYAPLWEQIDGFGYKMHDYLEHNDSYEVVKARIDRAEERRDGDRRRQRDFRDRQRERRAGERRHDLDEDESREDLPTSRVTSDPVTPSTEPVPGTPPVAKEQQQGEGTPRPRPMATIHDRSHFKHAVCGRICIHASQFGEFVRRRNHPDAEAEVRTWANATVDEWTSGAHQDDEPGDAFDFWRARYAERWPAQVTSIDRRTPAWAR